MKAWIKRRWVEALRSGDYTQGKGNLAVVRTLVDGESFVRHCCLGVLCELSPAMKTAPIRHPDMTILRFDDVSMTLPPSVQEWAGLSTDSPKVTIIDQTYDLALLNDDYDWADFERISDIIEESIPADVEQHLSPLPCLYCGGVGQCVTKSGRRTDRHSAALTDDHVWSLAHRSLDSGDIFTAVAHLEDLDAGRPAHVQ